MKAVIEKIGIRYKLQLPNLLYFFLSVVVGALFYNLHTTIDELQAKQYQLQDLAGLIRTFGFNAKSYLSKETDYRSLEAGYKTLKKEIRSGERMRQLDEIWKLVDQFRALNHENKRIENRIFDLTQTSMAQSDDYIKKVVKKLVDKNSRADVTELERLVIVGAHVNTVGNYEVRVKFLKAKEQLTEKKALLGYIATLLENVEQDVKRLKDTPFAMLPVLAKENNEKIKKLVYVFISNAEGQNRLKANLINTISECMQRIDAEVLAGSRGFYADIRAAMQNIVLILLGASLACIVICWLSARSIVNPLQDAVALSNSVCNGNLSRRMALKRSDEIGSLCVALNQMADNLEDKANLAKTIALGDLTRDVQLMSDQDTFGSALKTMMERLNKLVGDVDTTVCQVASGSWQVSNSSQALSEGASEQASSLEEITSSITQLSSQTKTNAENASTANQLAQSAQEAANQGAKKMQDMVTAMDEITASSKEISKIIKVIDDIAFQTNLLALNAAVEAARAGKYGKGFAVVAQEVRNLAARSAKAARETGDLIAQSENKVADGNAIANVTATAFQRISDSILNVTDLVGEIAAASNEQAQGISQINQGLLQIDSVTQQNTASAEETSAAAQELSSQAEMLKETVARFKIKKQLTDDRYSGIARPSSAPEDDESGSPDAWQSDLMRSPGS